MQVKNGIQSEHGGQLEPLTPIDLVTEQEGTSTRDWYLPFEG